ncbi:MAG: lytic transglycosylase domain-containing protein [bacterium]|nr:lytic transglycosylase domain-containing protein [bacterium]
MMHRCPLFLVCIIAIHTSLFASILTPVQAFYSEQYWVALNPDQFQKKPDSDVDQLLKAHALIKLSRPPKASKVLHDIPSSPGIDNYVVYLNIQIALLDNNIDEAERLLGMMYNDPELKVYTWTQLAIAEHDARPKRAIHYYELVRQETQDSRVLASTYRALWGLYNMTKQFDKANSIVVEWLAQYPDAVDHEYRLKYWSDRYDSNAMAYAIGYSYYKQRQYQDAIESLSQVQRNTKPYGKARVYLGLSYYFNYDFGTAIYVLKPIPNSILLDHNALIYIARSYQRLGKDREAIRAFEYVLKTKSVHRPNALYYLYYLSDNQSDKAKYKERLYKKHPNSSLVNKLIWTEVETHLENKDWIEAHNQLMNTSLISSDTELQARLSYWTAKTKQYFGEFKESSVIYNRILNQFPYTYYAYRSSQNLDESNVNFLNYHHVNQTTILSHKDYLLVNIGLADLVRQRLSQALLKANEDNTNDKEKLTHQLSYVYQLMGDYYESIQTIRRQYGRELYPQKDAELSTQLQPLLYPTPYLEWVHYYAKHYSIPASIVMAVMREESLFKTRSVSRARAVGLMQIMPQTGQELAKQLGVAWAGPSSLQDPKTNIQFGCYYLSRLYRQFGNWEHALMAYNAGLNRVKQWQKEYPTDDMDWFILMVPYDETKHYVKHVLQSYFMYQKADLSHVKSN